MPYSKNNNYTPDSFTDIMTDLMEGVNREFKTEFTYESFVGTGYFKYFYILAQVLLARENEFAEAYVKLQDFIRTTNERIAIPKTPREGLIKTFSDRGYTVSLRPQLLSNAGKLGVCVLADTSDADYDDKKKEILEILKDCTAAGLYYDGDQRGYVRLSNGQDFEFAFYLPTRKTASLRLTVTVSQNTSLRADDADEIRKKLLANIAHEYGLGKNFEPEKYFTISRDAPYAASVKLEWKTDGNFESAIYEANFRDLFVFSAERVEVTVNEPTTV